ncbi:uncharacterized protein LOC117899131 isoform X1 [Drosophila subobscura]|uniref:uncharacterized protein LOC117899131 isoform X1 n=2 Tax=Drosophila subobscura TaxID=7241 RepID=UPI00155A9048|nr:uncharacterized protein LOC117899131 isoform X1 [Drosophila subobscura]
MSRASTSERSNSEDSHSQSCLTEVLRNCADIQSLESLSLPHSYDYNERKMISPNPYSFSGNVSNSSCASEDVSFTDCILEDNGRISLAYENLRSIPRRLADKFAAQTKCLDLSHNDFRDLKFLSFFEDLDTLILDRNVNLDLNTLPYLPSLNILWINNCDVSNITDWIHRIERHCPALEQLSCMGNPGISTVFGSQGAEMAVARDYILQVLPNLKYLDGVPVSQNSGNGSHALSTSQGQCQDSTSLSGSGKISTPTLAFKNLFRLKPSPKSLCPGGARGDQMFGNGSSTN